MEPFMTYESQTNFSLALSDYNGNSFDNESALGLRFSIIFIETGSGIASVNHKQIVYLAPCIFCVNEQEHIVIPSSKNQSLRAIYFHPSIINSSLDYDFIRNIPQGSALTLVQDCDLIKFFLNRDSRFFGLFSPGPLSAKRSGHLIDGVHHQLTEQMDGNWPCRSRSYILEFLFLLDNLYTSGSCHNETYLGEIEEDFYPILLFLYNNYEKKITVGELTEKFHVNRTTLAEMFQNNVKQSLVSYLNQIRITMASNMLRDTLLPVSEIMYRVGFHDNAHFLRTFKKYMELSPSAYRDKYNWLIN